MTFRATLLAFVVPAFAIGQPLRIDLNPDNGRGDVKAPGWTPWAIADGKPAKQSFGKITIALESPGGVTANWWKAGFDHPAAMASDGALASKSMSIRITGLTKGPHSLATFHNVFHLGNPGTITLNINGQSSTATPTGQVIHDDRASANWLAFDVPKDGSEIVATLTADAGIVVNGIELDRPDPNRRAIVCVPAPDDEHVDPSKPLTWAVTNPADAYRVFGGTDSANLSLLGETKTPSWPTADLKLTHDRPYYWRIDSVRGKEITTGVVNRFRIRHLAFPEAEGYGRFAIGGRFGRVIAVTNLNDSGPGSLREAVEADGPRFVVFRVGGLIELKSKLIVRNPYLTIAGQTAPGDGICLKNYTVGCSDTHDVVIRHLRIRVGDESGLTQDGSGARGCDHVIFDHCSISWSIDEGFSSRQGKNLTVQRCLIAEALNQANHKKYEPGKGHSFAGSISGDIGSFHHNLLAHCAGRNWSLAGGLDRSGQRLAGRLDLRNNVVYNWQNRTTDGGVLEMNFVNNLYLPGPATKTHTLLKPDPGDWDRGMRAFMAGNVIEGKSFEDNWQAAVGPADGIAKVKSPMPLFEPFVVTTPIDLLLDDVLADAGATKPKRDAVDERVVADVKARSHRSTGSRGKLPGIVDTPGDSGGWPNYATGDLPKDGDGDGDGIPDDWESKHGLNRDDPADATRLGFDGYTNLEWYANSIAGDRASIDPKYRATIRQRADKAVAAAKVTEATARASCLEWVEWHYVSIFDVHAARDRAIAADKSNAVHVAAVRKIAAANVAFIHRMFVAGLRGSVVETQVDAIQDSMTYNVRPTTERVYAEMLPMLKSDEVTRIAALLRQGRDEAIVAGDANEKHEKFRIAKGKITNFLSSRGYDMKAAAAAWAEKQKKKPQ
jgi:hypothetical protein